VGESLQEARRGGFWLHHFLLAQRFENLVANSSSIEVSRRERLARSDRRPVRIAGSHALGDRT
jgi:hypothetical protein